jgi:hypothetical protein
MLNNKSKSSKLTINNKSKGFKRIKIPMVYDKNKNNFNFIDNLKSEKNNFLDKILISNKISKYNKSYHNKYIKSKNLVLTSKVNMIEKNNKSLQLNYDILEGDIFNYSTATKSKILNNTNNKEIIDIKSLSSRSNEYINNIYTYNKNFVKTVISADSVVNRLIRGFFTAVPFVNIKRSRRIDVKRRRNSFNNIFVSKPLIKHTNNTVKITIFLFNKKREVLINKIKDLNKYIVSLYNEPTKFKYTKLNLKNNFISKYIYNAFNIKHKNKIIKFKSLFVYYPLFKFNLYDGFSFVKKKNMTPNIYINLTLYKHLQNNTLIQYYYNNLKSCLTYYKKNKKYINGKKNINLFNKYYSLFNINKFEVFNNTSNSLSKYNIYTNKYKKILNISTYNIFSKYINKNINMHKNTSVLSNDSLNSYMNYNDVLNSDYLSNIL